MKTPQTVLWAFSLSLITFTSDDFFMILREYTAGFTRENLFACYEVFMTFCFLGRYIGKCKGHVED